MREINEQLLIFFNSFLEHDFMKLFVNIFADGPIFFLPLFLAGMWIYYSFSKIYKNSKMEVKNYKKDLLFIFYSTGFAITFNLIFQKIFHFARPDEICKLSGQLILDKIPEASFPSDHAAVSFAFATSLFLAGYKKTAATFTFFAILMNLSRIMACVHWPFDILVGAFVGIICAFITFKYIKTIKIVDTLNEWIISIMAKIKL